MAKRDVRNKSGSRRTRSFAGRKRSETCRPENDFVRGKKMLRLKRYNEAIEPLVRYAGTAGAQAGVAWMLAGFCFHMLGRQNAAVKAYALALENDGNLAEARNNLSSLLVSAERYDEALPHAEWLMEKAPTVDCLINTVSTYYGLAMWDKALLAAERVLKVKPMEPRVLSRAIRAAQNVCDWDALSRYLKLTSDAYRKEAFWGQALETHSCNISWCMNQQWNLEVARRVAGQISSDNLKCFRHLRRRYGKPLRVGYLSADFHNHAALHLMAGLFEHHDPKSIEVYAYCYSAPDQSFIRQRFENAVPNLVQIPEMTDIQAATRIYKDEIDILVDLKGFTRHTRQGIPARRPAPIQVAWLGFPGTSGTDYHDYIIADHVVTPDGSQPYFSEQLCRLPETYFPNDNDRAIADIRSTRAEHHLPEKSVVFCCFNQAYKLEPLRFTTFIAILKDVPESVLWLLDPGKTSQDRLRQYSKNHGIDPERLVFGGHVPVPLHLARIALADMALDTRIYTGHTTTVDALWAGVPVITTKGQHFASRVSESLLCAVNMPELAAVDEASMHRLAVGLALDSEKRQAIRAKLAFHRFRAPLFDTERFTRHIEAAYFMMAERAKKGMPPAEIDVPPLPPREGSFGAAVPRYPLSAFVAGERPKNEKKQRTTFFSG